MEPWRKSLYATWLGQMVAMMGFSAVLPFTPLYIQELGVTDPVEVKLWAGALTGATSIFLAIATPIWGVVSDRFGRKGMVLRACFAGAIVVWGMALSANIYQFLAFRILQGIFTGTHAASMTLAASVVPRQRLGQSLGLIQMAVYTGASIGPLVGGVLADTVGFHASFWIMGTLVLVAGVIVAVFVREEAFDEDGETGRRGDTEIGGQARVSKAEDERPADTTSPRRSVPVSPRPRVSASPRLRVPAGVRLLLESQTILVMTAVLFAAQFIRSLVSPILPLYVQEMAGPNEPVASLAGVILAVTGFTGAIAAVLAGRVADRLDYRVVLSVCSLGSALVHVPQALAVSNLQLVLLRGLTGFMQGGTLPTAHAAIAAVVPPERRGSVLGLANGMSAMGHAIGPVLGGALAAAFGVRTPFLVCAVLMGLVTIGVVRTGRRPVPGLSAED